jgi:hypothetical protein
MLVQVKLCSMEARVRKQKTLTSNHDTVEVLGDEQVNVKALNKLQMKNLRFQLRVSCHWAQTKY